MDAVVTGAGRGLGRAVTQTLARAGWTVWICSNDAEELETTAAMIIEGGGDAKSFVVDLASVEECRTFADAVKRDVGQLRALVNNAAVLSLTSVEQLTEQE